MRNCCPPEVESLAYTPTQNMMVVELGNKSLNIVYIFFFFQSLNPFQCIFYAGSKLQVSGCRNFWNTKRW